ncbi:MAG: aspartate kinase [Deltaproteobacteria bacterium]|uniref:Aspartokinase n=1 Tax=Candidatus Zymogenus saltonus TaxID=2844893 RepID=A0A9D8KG38_9DELT|nr:aspartate kinase [Candidatus Zymogenus saltonus]
MTKKDTLKKPIVVQKYGGSSVSDPERMKGVARRIISTKEEGNRVVVVVSAMGDTTDRLLDLAREVVFEPTARELDMLLTAGERISMTLLSMALNEMGHPAKSFTGSQSGIITDTNHSNARIIEVKPRRILEALESGLIVIVAGYQGVSTAGEVTTLGRGGSDTSAVALAAAVNADYLEICSDVDGILTADPRIVSDAVKIDSLSYEEMQEMAEAGAKVLNSAAVEYAKRAGIKIHSVSTFSGKAGETGTVVGDFFDNSRTGVVRGVVSEREVVYVTAAELISMSAINEILDFLDNSGVEYKQFNLNRYGDDRYSFSCVLPLENLHGYDGMKSRLMKDFPGLLLFSEGLGALSLIGEGITNDGKNLMGVISSMEEAGIAIHDIHTSRFRISAMVDREKLNIAVKICHDRFIGG